MHTREIGNTRFIFNGDLSGNVEIVHINTGKRFEVNGKHLIEFIGEFAKNRKISKLEGMTGVEFLDIL